ncbi:hypothetical protein EMPS_10529 [Entomortierella parvispora]|uniref:SH3 domain-containing protein n=1 Tax=Entomortierella parvispora TaxID=205924 RepID=A0A9P3HKC5_9FUNG|nr:hypothetical protein EMPS_10529 [Entomortierella parvispora]
MQNHGLPVLCTVRVVYAFLAKEDGDLNLNKGDIIKVHDNEGGWWKGTLLSSQTYGSFPSNFVEIVNESPQNIIPSARPPQPHLQQQQSRPHSRQSSVDSSKFTKRKPVASSLSSNGNINVPPAAAQQRKNPQAIIGDMTDLQDTLSPSSPSTAPGGKEAILAQPVPNEQHNSDTTQPSGAAAQSRFGQLTSHISQLLGSPASGRSLFGQSVDKPPSLNQESTPDAPASPSSKEEVLKKSDSTSIMTGSFPGVEASPTASTKVSVLVSNEAMYNPHYADKRRSSAVESTSTMNPSRPGVRNKVNNNVLSPTQNVGGHQVGNRYSMPNLVGEIPPPQKQQLDMSDDDMTGGRNLSHAEDPQLPGIMPRSTVPTNYYSQQFMPVQMHHQQHQEHQQQQSGPYPNGAQQEQYDPRYRHSIASFGVQPQSAVDDRLHQLHLHQLQELYSDGCTGSSVRRSELSLENLAKHNRSQGSLGMAGTQDRQSSLYQHPAEAGAAGHGRSLSQVNLRSERSKSFDQQTQQEQQLQRRKAGHHTAPLGRMQPKGSRVPSPGSIVIPQPTKTRPQSSHAAFGQSFVSSPTDSEANSSGLTSPAPTTGTPKGETPTSAGTTMSATSASYSQYQPPRGDFRQKSKTARMPISTSMTMANFAVRKFSVDARGALSNLRAESASQLPNRNRLAREGSVTMANISSLQMAGEEADQKHDRGNESGQDEDISQLGTYTAKKPKATLIRAFKQIINPRKVAEKDAIKNKNEHFAWIEMQKSLKRVNSPEPGKERAPFLNGATAPTMESSNVESPVQDTDPFFALHQCQVIKDPGVVATSGASITSLDIGPNMFAQVDKVARNVNQRSPHMTPQLLSQKYLTRPYSKSPLSKLRVLFVWVSENIRLEGGPVRDVSGGRYKLGPAGDHMSALSAAAVAAGLGSPNMHRSSGTGSSILAPTMASTAVGSPIQYSDPAFTTGMEEFARGFLQDDAPELAQEVLTTRTSKTGEGFANLFAEMALAAGIEDIGVVKGFIKGPMDVFSKEIAPANHAWNVVRIDGQYRFIDCCLASPFHPAHYPNRPQQAASFYFLTSPMDLVMSHFPTFLTYQYVTPSIPPQIFLKMPFVRPAFFELGMNLVDFKRRSRLDIKDDENVEIVIRIDGCGGGPSSGRFGPQGVPGDGVPGGNGMGGNTGGSAACTRTGSGMHGTYGGECLGLGCGEGVELRAEVEAMSLEGKVIRKRALAQVMIWNPYHQLQLQPHLNNGSTLVMPVSGPSKTATLIGGYATGGRGQQGLSVGMQSHHCSGVKVAKIKAVLPPETVEGPNGVRKGVVHIYAGRKVENAPSDATPYSLALTLPIQHTGTMPKTPFNFVLPHFSPYEFYIKAPQSELLYYPHTYKFSVLSLAAQAQAAAASATAVSVAMADNDGIITNTALASATTATFAVTATTAHSALAGIGMVGTVSMAPLYNNNLYHARGGNSGTPPPPPMTMSSTSSTLNRNNPYAQSASTRPPLQHHQKMNSSVSMASTSSLSVSRGQHAVAASNSTNSILSQVDVSCSSNSYGGTLGSTFAVPRPERLVLRTQTNRLYKLVYDPVRQCHEAQVEVKERGIWECVRMDDGGKGRVAREGTGGVVIASWKCV